MYTKIDVGDPYSSESEWCDSAFTFDYTHQIPPKNALPGAPQITFRQWFEKQSDPSDPSGANYGRCIFVYAARVARVVENGLEVGEGQTKEQFIALLERAEKEVDQTKWMGITGFQHGAAMGTLRQTWKHGQLVPRSF